MSATGNSTAAEATGTGLWYMQYVNEKCVKDCKDDGTDNACGGVADPWVPKYDTLKNCCRERGWWSKECPVVE